jgi:acid phosphatase type 7
MRRMATVLALGCVAACSSPSGSDDDAGTTTPTDPAWPAHTPLPPELDFPPYLNLVDATTVAISWRTTEVTTGTIRYGTTASALASEVTSSTPGNLHHVTLANLEPATAYHYEVAIAGTDVTRPGVFVTPGATRWRFLALGEYHAPSFSTSVGAFAESVRAFRPHVVVESGDMVDDGDDLTQWRSYLRTSAPWISNVLLLPAHSNHVNGSGGNEHLLDLFVLPNNERWYDTRYGQVQFVTLDSHGSGGNADVETEQVPWIASVAAAAHDGIDDPTFLIGLWHHPACSSQYASRATSRIWVHDHFVQTFQANGGIDLILAAHDKYYERSTITGGIVHVITNIGSISPEIPGQDHPSCTAVKTERNTRSTALVTVDGATLSARIIDDFGDELDTFSIAK